MTTLNAEVDPPGNGIADLPVLPGLCEESELWGRRLEPACRRELVERFLPFAGGIALHYFPRSELSDDLVRIAGVVLQQTVDRYDPDRDPPFIEFAGPVIHAEMKRTTASEPMMRRVRPGR